MIVTSGVIAYLTVAGVMTNAPSIDVQISCVDGKAVLIVREDDKGIPQEC
jgi:hypothetical protein